MEFNKKWFLVYTRPCCEKKVSRTLFKNNIENFVPLSKRVIKKFGRETISYEPIFKNYVLINIMEKDLLQIKKTDGVINFVYWHNNPVVLKDEDVDVIRLFLSTHQNVMLEKSIVSVNEPFSIRNNVQQHTSGDYINIINRSVQLYLPTLGYTLVAHLKNEMAETTEMPIHSINQTEMYDASF